MNYKNAGFMILFLSTGFIASSQISTYLKPGETVTKVFDSKSDTTVKPDADRDDIPFIDYRPAIIWTSSKDTIHEYGYIRKNFTDQLLSIWNPPRRLYPASRIYAVSLDGNYYRTLKVSKQNYVFAQRMVKGNMSLYMYRKIPQTSGWIEFVSADANNPGYTNYMIVEENGRRGSWNQYGYYISIVKDTSALIPVQQSTMNSFALDYLSDTPLAQKEAFKFGKKNYNKTRKILLASLMTVGMAGTFFGHNDGRWLFMVGFPLAAIVGIANRPNTLHWDDLVRIVDLHNRELTDKESHLQ